MNSISNKGNNDASAPLNNNYIVDESQPYDIVVESSEEDDEVEEDEVEEDSQIRPFKKRAVPVFYDDESAVVSVTAAKPKRK